MPNSLKLLTRTSIILALMIIGSWLSAQMILPEFASGITIYAVYLLIGVMLGSMANPRFTKSKNKWIYVLPILIFIVIGALPMLYALLHVAAWPFDLGSYFLNFSTFSWTVVGYFLNFAFR